MPASGEVRSATPASTSNASAAIGSRREKTRRGRRDSFYDPDRHVDFGRVLGWRTEHHGRRNAADRRLAAPRTQPGFRFDDQRDGVARRAAQSTPVDCRLPGLSPAISKFDVRSSRPERCSSIRQRPREPFCPNAGRTDHRHGHCDRRRCHRYQRSSLGENRSDAGRTIERLRHLKRVLRLRIPSECSAQDDKSGCAFLRNAPLRMTRVDAPSFGMLRSG